MEKKLKIFLIVLFFLNFPLSASADYVGQRTNFFINSSYDSDKRQNLQAVLVSVSNKLYFYIDENWWNLAGSVRQGEIKSILSSLGDEFDRKIYPTLTGTFGFEQTPGIDDDSRITVLIHPMIENAGGYFNSGDEYPRLQVQNSNQREMLYLNASYLNNQDGKVYLAHEFLHLITFNQKDRAYGVTEETWLNEGRAEYVSTLLGYDDAYEGSNLQKRVKIFLDKPSDSLTIWKGEKADYGVISLFIHYLVDHYGTGILVDSLKTKKIGISSINESLLKSGAKENFAQIFTNWKIAVFTNNCFLGENYCFLNPNLRNLKIVPPVYLLSLMGESTFSINYNISDWAANWYKIIGGKGTLTLDFNGENAIPFNVPYLLCDYQGACKINFLNLNSDQDGQIVISDFSSKYSSLTLIPSVQFQSTDSGYSHPFSWKASVVDNSEESNAQPDGQTEQVAALLARIEQLKKEIAAVKAKLEAARAGNGAVVCSNIAGNLSFGIRGSDQVSCLQDFLKRQGAEIYPEGLVTGNFGFLTQAAVIRFQEKYSQEILKPLGLERGTGYVGSATREVINRMIGS